MRVFLLVTGASRGFGRAVAVKMAEDLDVVAATLVSRSSMDEVASIMKSFVPSIHCVQADLSDISTLDNDIDKILATVSSANTAFDRLIFVNNAGSLGHIGKAIHVESLAAIRQSIDFNVTSSLWMSVRVGRLPCTKLIINVSSLVAVQPFPSLAVYSCGKAARDSFTSTMAKEGLETLNYAPGPLETDMTQELRSADTLDDTLKPAYAKQLVDPMDSAAALVDLIATGKYTSGDHVDYFDLKAP